MILKAVGVAGLGMSLAGCALWRSVDCGPLTEVNCEQQAAQIVSVVERENPGRRVVSIVFINEEGHALVRLDDDTEIGWGERL